MDKASKSKKIGLALAVLIILIALGLLFKSYKRPTGEISAPKPTPLAQQHKGPCPGETKTFTMQDPYMRGILESGQKFEVIMNYYECNPPKRGDLVFYQLHHSMDP